MCNLVLQSAKVRAALAVKAEVIIKCIAAKIEPFNWKTGAANLLCNLVGKEAGRLNEGNFTKLACEVRDHFKRSVFLTWRRVKLCQVYCNLERHFWKT